MTKALAMLPLADRQLIEDYYIAGVTLERLSREQQSHIKTVRKRIRMALEKLRAAERELP
jgi:DNA-directed RNA polymerase specialized sigma24 family protein